MKRFRILFIGLVVLAMLATTGCFFNNPSKEIIGTWVSNETVGGNQVRIELVKSVGFCVLDVFGYSFDTVVTWGDKQWTFTASEDDASRAKSRAIGSRETPAMDDTDFSVWFGFVEDAWDGSNNCLWIGKATDSTYEDIQVNISAYLLGNSFKCEYLMLENTAYVDSTASDQSVLTNITFVKQ